MKEKKEMMKKKEYVAPAMNVVKIKRPCLLESSGGSDPVTCENCSF